jgi:opine dehydrogenase
LHGFPVRLYSRTADKLAGIRERGGIVLEGQFRGFGRMATVTSDLAEALDGARVVLVAISAAGHQSLAEAMVPHLSPGQVVVLNPGRTGGALEVYRIFRDARVDPSVTVAETQTFIFACRALGEGRAHIFQCKREVPVAAIPAARTRAVVRLMRRALTAFVPAGHVLETSLSNVGGIFHPAPLLLNAGRIESGQTFDYYREGITPAVARVLEAIDAERMAVAESLGVRVISAREWLRVAYGAGGTNLHEATSTCPAYVGLSSPRDLDGRYLHEDVPTSLVPIAALGRLTGTATTAIDAIVDLACLATGVNFRAIGRTLERMGLAGMDAREVAHYVLKGADSLARTRAAFGGLAEEAYSSSRAR